MKSCPKVVCVPLRIYVAGQFSPIGFDDLPFDKKLEKNVRIADDIAQQIVIRGHIPFCPHAMSRDWYKNDNPVFRSYDVIVKRIDFSFLRFSDAIFRLQDWEKSKGAIMEACESLRIDLWFFDSIDELPEVVPNEENIYMLNKLDEYNNHRRRRLILGATEYGDDWQVKDNLASAQEECYDLDNYPFLEYLKLERMRAHRDGKKFPPEE